MVAAAPAGTPSWVHPVERYPEPVRQEIARRREVILGRATGRVLDLDDPDVAVRFLPLATTGFSPPAPVVVGDERYDTVVATGVLGAFADLGAVTAALAAFVAAEGALLFVEPVGVPGWASTVRTSLPDPRWSRAPWRALHLDRDVPAAVRASGLVVCDLDRGVLPGQPPSLRHWVTGRALRIVAG